MAWTRASSLGRTLQCTGSAFLFNNHPELKLVPKSEAADKAARYGTMVHYWKETGKVEGHASDVKTFSKKLEYLKACGVGRLDYWPATGFHEVATAYNCLDGRVAILYEGDTNAFKTGHSEPWITGSCDYYDLPDGSIWVDDLKTGAMWDGTAETCAQLYFYMMCLARIHQMHRKYKVSITHWPRYPIENVPVRDECELTAGILDKFEQRLKKDYQNYKTGNPNYRLGDECTYCPVTRFCPLQRG